MTHSAEIEELKSALKKAEKWNVSESKEIKRFGALVELLRKKQGLTEMEVCDILPKFRRTLIMEEEKTSLLEKRLDELIKMGFLITAYDPAATANIKKQFGDKIDYAYDMYEALHDADALCILTEWNDFKQANITKIKNLLKNPIIIDGRNIYNPEKMKKYGISYISTGRKSV